MSDRPDYEAARPSYWRAIEHRRKVGIIATGALLVLAIAGALALSATRPPSEDVDAETTRTITPAEETSATTVTVPSYGATATAEGETPSGSSAAGAPQMPAITPAPLVAYRREGWLCVAGENGAGERRVAESTAGAFALSPDGTTIAYVDSGTASLVLADVGSGGLTPVGAASQDPPSWSPDSGWLVYTAPGPNVTLATRDGLGTMTLFSGSLPCVATTGGMVAGLAPSGELVIWRGGSVSRVRVTGAVTGLASDGVAVLYGAIATQAGAVDLRTVGLDGRGDRPLVSGAAASRTVTFGSLLLSPDGKWLAYAELGDDGYSRMFALPATGGDRVPLSVRRDCYPLRWTADGTSVLFIEGNAFQGEPTTLMRVNPTGGSRRLLLSGAGR